jgi:hypothetical protein
MQLLFLSSIREYLHEQPSTESNFRKERGQILDTINDLTPLVAIP